MAKIEKFEDLICWQKSRILVREIYAITSKNLFSRDFTLKDQLRRAVLSIMLNIAESFGRRTHKEFKHFLFMAHGSVAETQSCLYIALDVNYLSQELLNACMKNVMRFLK